MRLVLVSAADVLSCSATTYLMSVDHSTKRNIQLPDSPDECFGVGIKVIQNAYM